MTSKQYRAVIIRSLLKAQRNPPTNGADGLADMIVADISDLKAILEEIDEPAPTPRYAAPTYESTLIVPASDFAKAIRPISDEENQRIPSSVQRSYSEEELTDIKVRAVLKLKDELPKSISVTIPSLADPIVLLQQNVSSSPGFMSSITIQYVPPNAVNESQLVRVVKDATRDKFTTESIIAEIRDTATMMFSATPKKVVTHLPPPIMSADDLMDNAVSATIDPETTEADLREFRQLMSGQTPPAPRRL